MMTHEEMIAMAREAGCVEASHPFNPWSVSQEALERFAESIVRECIAQVRKDENGPAYEAAGRIAEHFGIE